MKRSFIANLVIVGLLLVVSTTASSRIIKVGSNERIKTIAEAARVAHEDDVVEIAAGEYRGDVATWTQKRLTIRGVGGRPMLNAAGKSAEGKAIWVVRDGDFTVVNIEFRGARVSDGNGAGIRFEKGKLKVIDCTFIDNQNGILTANFSDAKLSIESSVFAQAPRDAVLPHLLYVGRIAQLKVINSRFHNGYRGHLLKSRARMTEIRYSLLVDGEGGNAAYEADFPNGGDVTMIGNVLGQSATPDNPTIVAYGAEGGGWPVNRLRMVHNTLYSEGPKPAWFLRVFADKLGVLPDVITRNNLVVGVGLFTANVGGQHLGNYFAPYTFLGDPAIMDFTLDANSWYRGMVDPIEPDREGLQPKFEHVMPGRVLPIRPSPSFRWAPGAIQSATISKP